jgi:tellurite resistance protein TerC
MLDESWFWIFNAFVAVLLFLDLVIFHRKAHVVEMKEALLVSAFWIGLALVFNLYVYSTRGMEAALNFLTGYIVEKSLSVDNLFVFLLIFSYFKVPKHLLHKVLFWGIFGAIVMRAVFIMFGILLIQQFYWVLYIFGIFLVFTGIKLALEKDKEYDPASNMIIKLFQRFIPVTHEYDEANFFTRKNKRLLATPLFVVLIAIETTDVIFAVDSIPAIIGITQDPFIIYTSNILAILGLRSLYFALSHSLTLFHYLHYGLAFILVFIGVKMLIANFFHIPILISLGVIALVLIASIIASLMNPKKAI